MTSNELTLETLDREFKRFAEGVHALAVSLEKSDSIPELQQFLATVYEWRNGLYMAEIPANTRLQWLEICERHNSLSWVPTS